MSFEDPWVLRLLRKLGQIVDTAGLSDDEAAEAVRAIGPDGIVAYADAQLGTASALAERLGLHYHDSNVSRRLLDKVRQRAALAEGGLSVPRCTGVPHPATADAVAALIDRIDFPVVMKPRSGAGSQEHTPRPRRRGVLRDFEPGGRRG